VVDSEVGRHFSLRSDCPFALVLMVRPMVNWSVWLQVLYKRRIGGTTDLGRISFSVSAIACFTLFTMWPIVLILYLTKAERWEWESIPWGIVCKNSAASFGKAFQQNTDQLIHYGPRKTLINSLRTITQRYHRPLYPWYHGLIPRTIK
jgi:hypothetical protein